MISTEISIVDNISPDLRRKIEQLENTAPLMRAVGVAMSDAMKRHYEKQPSNRRGFPSKDFWRKFGRNKVRLAWFDKNYAQVIVDSVEMAHKFYGGTVRPKKGRALSIPLSPEAYKTGSASLWRGKKLTLIQRAGKHPLLVDTSNPNAWHIHYVLVPSVTHQPDKRAHAPRNVVDEAIGTMIRHKINLIWRVSQ